MYRVALADVLDDSRNINVGLAAYALMVITSVSAPATANAGELIEIVVGLRNEGEAGLAWLHASDLDTGEDYLAYAQWPVELGFTADLHFVVTMPSRDLRIGFEVGHVE